MQEIGIKSEILQSVLDGSKTIEVRLGKPAYIKIRVGDDLSVREDIWQDGKIIESIPGKAVIRVTQLLYFESFEELLSAVSYSAILPMASSKTEALHAFRDFYSATDEYEYGVMAITFTLQNTN